MQALPWSSGVMMWEGGKFVAWKSVLSFGCLRYLEQSVFLLLSSTGLLISHQPIMLDLMFSFMLFISIIIPLSGCGACFMPIECRVSASW